MGWLMVKPDVRRSYGCFLKYSLALSVPTSVLKVSSLGRLALESAFLKAPLESIIGGPRTTL